MRRVRAIVLVSLLLLSGCSGGLPEGVIYPSITVDESVAADIPVTSTFTFESQPVTIATTVDGELYAGADAAEKAVIRFGNARENDWIDDYFPAFVEEPHQDAFFADLLGQLRAVRDQRGLDSDRYAELMTVFVQSLAYVTDPVDLEPKFPVETYVDQNGDCDDKTLLLAGLLAREGYDVAILLFEPEQHVSLGIRSADIGYLDTGYAFTETTSYGFVGMVPDEFAGGIELTSTPRVFKIGSGTVPYTAGAQVARILDGRERAVAEAATLADRIREADATLEALRVRVETTRATMDGLSASGRVAEYNAMVPEYNALVEDYNNAANERNQLAEQHNKLADIDRLIIEGLDDRPAVYAAVTAALP